jgi:hypothetical protein
MVPVDHTLQFGPGFPERTLMSLAFEELDGALVFLSLVQRFEGA